MTYFADNLIEEIISKRAHFIFDMNGLLIDDEHLQLNATNEAFAGFGLQLSDHLWRERCVGHKPLEYLPILLQELTGSSVGLYEIKNSLNYKDRIYNDLIGACGSSILREGVISFLNYLSKSGKVVSLCTSTTKAGMDCVLNNENMNLNSLFRYSICGDDVKHSKPNPEIYLAACAQAGRAISESIAFEDSQTGLMAAVNAGITCIVCPNDFTKQQDFSGASLVISNLTPDARPRT